MQPDLLMSEIEKMIQRGHGPADFQALTYLARGLQSSDGARALVRSAARIVRAEVEKGEWM